MAMVPVPLFGSGIYGKSAVVTRQRRVNCYYENRADGDKAKVVVYGTPCLVLVFTTGSLPIRGLLSVNESTLYAVIYNQFGLLAPPASPGGAAVFTVLGTINTIAGFVSLAPSPNSSQIMLVDGVGGWIYQPLLGTFIAATAAWFTPGAATVVNVAGYFVCEQPGSPNFAVSNINDATGGGALSTGAAVAYPDNIEACEALAGNLINFSRQHLEFWQNVGAPPPGQPFQLIVSSPLKIGLPALFARTHIDNTLVFMGETEAGTKRVYRIDGFNVTPISEEIDWIINQPGFVYADATMLSYQRDKHPFAQLTFPTMGRSFLFDLSTNIPGETQTGLSTGAYQRHQGNLSSYYNGDTIIADYANGNVYRMDDGTFADNGVPVLREVVTKHHIKGFNRFRVPQLYLDFETGVGTSSGQGLNPQVSIECSKDNGRTWLQARLIPLGAMGQFVTRVNARRFGQGRVFTWRIRMTDPVKFVITDGAIRRKGKKETN
jgi:hypothetical protein